MTQQEAPPAIGDRLDWQGLLEEALETPGSISDAYTRFYSYSFLNCLMMRMQGMEGPVATYKRWQELGRHVVKGAKAKVILRPITITKKNDDGEVEAKFTRFKHVRAVFDYKDTDGDELPPPAPIAEWDEDRALTALEIVRVPFVEMNGNIMGYSTGREVAINPLAEHPQKTMFHEIGHVVIGHTEPTKLMEYVLHRGTFEFQAESTAYLSMHELDVLDEQSASDSRGYIQSWLRGEHPPETAIRPVFSAVDKILRAGRPPELSTVELYQHNTDSACI